VSASARQSCTRPWSFQLRDRFIDPESPTPRRLPCSSLVALMPISTVFLLGERVVCIGQL
jgi:hypothetical protein